jgi:hypothetical protein
MSQQQQETDYGDLEPKTALVRFGPRRFVVRELSAADQIKHNNALEKYRIRGEDGRFVGLSEGWGEADLVLCSLCVFENVASNGDGYEIGSPLNLEDIHAWPDRVREALVGKIVELCPSLRVHDTVEGLTKQIEDLGTRLERLQGKDISKNAPSATTELSE